MGKSLVVPHTQRGAIGMLIVILGELLTTLLAVAGQPLNVVGSTGIGDNPLLVGDLVFFHFFS
jgi:hypothetical protein